jgi:hypothetical protein
MAWSQTDIDNLRAAIASGQVIVRSGDRSIQYRSLAEMRDLLAQMESEIAGRPTGIKIGRNKARFKRD